MSRQYEKNKLFEKRLADVANKQQELKERIERLQKRSRKLLTLFDKGLGGNYVQATRRVHQTDP